MRAKNVLSEFSPGDHIEIIWFSSTGDPVSGVVCEVNDQQHVTNEGVKALRVITFLDGTSMALFARRED